MEGLMTGKGCGYEFLNGIDCPAGDSPLPEHNFRKRLQGDAAP